MAGGCWPPFPATSPSSFFRAPRSGELARDAHVMESESLAPIQSPKDGLLRRVSDVLVSGAGSIMLLWCHRCFGSASSIWGRCSRCWRRLLFDRRVLRHHRPRADAQDLWRVAVALQLDIILRTLGLGDRHAAGAVIAFRSPIAPLGYAGAARRRRSPRGDDAIVVEPRQGLVLKALARKASSAGSWTVSVFPAADARLGAAVWRPVPVGELYRHGVGVPICGPFMIRRQAAPNACRAHCRGVGRSWRQPGQTFRKVVSVGRAGSSQAIFSR